MCVAINEAMEQRAALYGSGAKSHKAMRIVDLHALGKLVLDFRNNVIVALPNWRSVLPDFATFDATRMASRKQNPAHQTGKGEKSEWRISPLRLMEKPSR
jgi:hypothetical protein